MYNNVLPTNTLIKYINIFYQHNSKQRENNNYETYFKKEVALCE